MPAVFVKPKQKPDKVSADGLFAGVALTALAMTAMTAYANAWVSGQRDLELERKYPGLADEFYVVRADSEYALRFADEPKKKPAIYVPA